MVSDDQDHDSSNFIDILSGTLRIYLIQAPTAMTTQAASTM